jgi:glycosyltransferase involved in cell wall biosynthesis
MAIATGEILTWLNADDRLAPGALASIALAFHTSNADLVAGICRLYKNGKFVHQDLTACADGPLPLAEILDLDRGWNAGKFFYQPEVMFTRDLWLRAGGRVDESLYYSMDYELWLRFAEVGAKVHVIGRPVAWFRLHEQQKTHVAERFKKELVLVRDAFANARGFPPSEPAPSDPPRESLRITFLNDHGGCFGAGIAHVRLARAIARAGHEVSLVAIVDRPQYGQAVAGYTVQSVVDRVAATRPDILIIGNLHNAGVEPILLDLLCERFPTMVVLHDFWLLTGRCAYSAECEKHLTGCDETCPTATEYPSLPPTEIASAWHKKRLLLHSDRSPILLANSSWAASIARKALRIDTGTTERSPKIERFQLSFPLDSLIVRDRRTCRDALGLPQDRFIVLLPGSLEDPRKGGRPLLEALARLEFPNLLIVTLGQVSTGWQSPVELLQLGYIADPSRIAQLNSAADVVAIPSTVETFGQVCVEAIACGTPVVGYPVAGVREAVQDGVTGILAADTSPASLAVAIHLLYRRPDLRRNLAVWGRLHVENEWSEYSAYQRFFVALQETGLDKRLNLRRKVGFGVTDPALPPIESVWKREPRWSPRRGFSWPEKSAESGLHAFWWMYGPSALAEISADTTGPHHILVVYRTPHDRQRLRILSNGDAFGPYELPRTGFQNGRLLVLETHLQAGPNLLYFEFLNDPPSDTERPPIMMTDILVEPVTPSPRDSAYGDQTAAEVLARVWGQSQRRE